MAIIISYPTSASGIIVLLKTPPKYRKLDYNKNIKAQKITHMLAVFVDHWLITRDGLANQNSRFALSNDPVFNNNSYTITTMPCNQNPRTALSNDAYIIMPISLYQFVIILIAFLTGQWSGKARGSP